MNTSRRAFIQKSTLTAFGISSGINAFALPWETDLREDISSEKIKFPISIFSKHLQWLEYKEMAEFAASVGFDGVDLTVRPGGHVLPERVTEDLPKAVKAIREAGLEVYMISTGITDPDDQFTEDILKTAGNLHIPFYRIGWFNFNESLSLDKNLDDFKNRFKKLAAMGKKYNICGDYQNHSGTSMGGSIWDLWLSFKNEDPKWVGCQYDIRHATVEGAHSWPVGLQLVKPYIHTLDFKDFYWKKAEDGWHIENVPLGEGMIEYKKYFELIKKYNIAGPISLHYEYDLGGAEHGNKTISMENRAVKEVLKKDLQTLRGWLKEYVRY